MAVTLCRNGHEIIRVPGQPCVVCKRIANTASKRRKRARLGDGSPELPKLPIDPLIDLIGKACERYADPTNNSRGQRSVAAMFAHRYGIPQITAERLVSRILTRRNERVMYTTADEWCIALGTHISLVYDSTDLDANELIEVEA